MVIETRYELMDKVYFMKSNKVVSGTIDSINVEVSHNMYLVPIYKVQYLIEGKVRPEGLVFKSKPELLDSL